MGVVSTKKPREYRGGHHLCGSALANWRKDVVADKGERVEGDMGPSLRTSAYDYRCGHHLRRCGRA